MRKDHEGVSRIEVVRQEQIFDIAFLAFQPEQLARPSAAIDAPMALPAFCVASISS